MEICCLCGGPNLPERAASGLRHCLACATANPRLARPEYIVTGQHKSGDLIVGFNDPLIQRHESLYRK